jgi:outer membrane protein assembly factor BamA
VTFLADYRRYFFFEPVTFAVRGLHLGNYGAQRENLTDEISDSFVRETLGDPYQLAFVRGYAFSSLLNEPACRLANDCDLDRLYGTRIAVGSAELRLPLLGTDALGLATFPYLPTELVLFTDAGIAWTGEDLRSLTFTTTVPEEASLTGSDALNPVRARPVVSSGVSARVNLLGALVMELFYARTFQRTRTWDFGVVLRPGW